MANQRSRRFLRIYDVIHSVSVILCALCLIGACLSIYDFGSGSYSREAIAQAFSPIALPVYLCLVLTVGSVVLALVIPREKPKALKGRDLAATARRLYQTRDTSGDSLDCRVLRSYRRERMTYNFETAAVCAAAAVFFLIYALNGSYFLSDDINGSMVRAMWRLIPCLVIALGAALYCQRRCLRLLDEEIKLLRQLPKVETGNRKCQSSLLPWQLLLAAAAIGLIVWGAACGGIADVLAKANNICTECIGLG